VVKKRPSAFDALGDIAPPKHEEDITREVQHKRYGKPATYRLPEELIEALKQIAEEERVKIADLATFALQSFVRDYKAGKVTLPKSEPARYRLELD
jgi:hypothetical protein